MPLLLYGPGGGGPSGNGAGRYVYPIGNVISPSIDINGNAIALKWRDPDDAPLGGGLAEWKGTIVVAKQGSPPMDADDGEWIADITEKNSHVENALMTDVGGVGYYYGFFPYTKDYVVNNNKENTLIADGGLLMYTPWADIAAASANGTASEKWAVGDEKKITLTGAYAGEHTFVIADFSHDDLSDGSGKAGITFASKGSVASVTRGNSNKWTTSYLRSQTVPAVKGCFPNEVLSKIKTVNKLCNIVNSSGDVQGQETTKDDLFIPSFQEICTKTVGVVSLRGEGVSYPLYNNVNDVLPNGEYHLRTVGKASANAWYTALINQTGAGSGTKSSSDLQKKYGLIIMFCV